MMRLRLAVVLGVGLLVAATASIARAAEEDDPNAWHLTFTPYLWAAGLYGDVTVRGVNARSTRASSTSSTTRTPWSASRDTSR